MAGARQPLARKKAQCKEDLFFTMKLAWQKLSKYYDEVTPTMGMLPISANTID